MSQPSSTATLARPGNRGSPWWRSAVVYQVYPRSFADADGDGMGDLPGITSRLEHIRDLGADAIWLSPFYTSPQNDGGYDVSDYTDVDPRFGTLDDADTLIARAHGLGLRVIVDVVPNHSSSEHVLFQQALAAGPGSPEREMYIFRDGAGDSGELPPNNWTSIFHGDAWTRVTEPDGRPGQWYLHLFDTTQPDWNWDDPRVHELFEDVLRFWLDRGVDGFRVDVAHGMAKPEGLPDSPTNEAGMAEVPEGEVPVYFDNEGVHAIYRRWRSILEEYEGERVMVGEAWIPEQSLPKYVRADEMHQVFNFGFLQARWEPSSLRQAIAEPLRLADLVGAPTTWVLSNHDVIRHASRYGFPPQKSFGEGLTRHEVPDAQLGMRRARAATMLMLALPGSAYLYQGEELGLPEADVPDELREDPRHTRAGVPGRDGCRVPIPWERDAPAFGFSPTGASWLPQPAQFGPLAADQQRGADGSMLELYRRALRLRRELRLGEHDEGTEVVFEESAPAGVLVLDHGAVRVVVNTSSSPIDLTDVTGGAGAEVLLRSAPVGTEGEPSGAGAGPQSSVTGDGPESTVAGDSAVWLRLSR